MKKIPLARPHMGEEEVLSVSKVIRSGTLSLGPKLKEFEEGMAGFIGTKYAIAANSGTSALHLCIKALGIRPGDEVITSPFSFVASSNPVIFEGGKPVFVDIEEKTYNMDPAKVEAAITAKTRAIVPVHIFGHPCDMDAIMKIAKSKKIPVIEDACESLGSEYKGIKAGSFGKAGVFAFYANKQITTGEGGMIVTNDSEMAAIYKSLRNQGRNDSGEWLNHVRIGYNYRLNEMSCALGVEQLKKINFILKKRENIANTYNQAFKGIGGIITPHTEKNVKNSFWVYYLRVEENIDRDKALSYLNDNGISARACFYPPIHLQPIYKKTFGYKGGEFPVAEKVSKSGFIIPFFVDITNEEIEKVCTTVKEAVRRHKR